METIVDNDGILWLNEKHIEGLDHKNLRFITKIYSSNYRKCRYKLVDEPNFNSTEFFLKEELATKVIIVCRAAAAHKSRTKLGFKQYDVILTKEQSVLTKIKISSEGENMQTQYSVLGYRIDLNFHDYKLAMEIESHSL